ncbi:single-stranded DNA-binding protein [Bifidobacterium aemilianum]|nr:single-stranded DNA-binding protein [Bifidobacterium aemilianum]
MSQQAMVTMSGFAGADPVSFGREGGPVACSLRLGSTRSYYSSAEQEWREQPTTWITVKAFRGLAANILASVHKGDAVIAIGLLITEEWERDGAKRSRIVMEASGLGHDLNLGLTAFTRNSGKQGFVGAPNRQQKARDPFAQAQAEQGSGVTQGSDPAAGSPSHGQAGDGKGPTRQRETRDCSGETEEFAGADM